MCLIAGPLVAASAGLELGVRAYVQDAYETMWDGRVVHHKHIVHEMELKSSAIWFARIAEHMRMIHFRHTTICLQLIVQQIQ